MIVHFFSLMRSCFWLRSSNSLFLPLLPFLFYFILLIPIILLFYVQPWKCLILKSISTSTGTSGTLVSCYSIYCFSYNSALILFFFPFLNSSFKIFYFFSFLNLFLSFFPSFCYRIFIRFPLLQLLFLTLSMIDIHHFLKCLSY